jgi:hypothetical protein
MNIKNDAYGINIEDIEEYIDVENVIHEWCQSISFINREIRHLCTRFNDGQSFSYADESFYRKSTRIDKQFVEGQLFEVKTQLKIKLARVHMEHNMKLNVQNRNRSILYCDV